MMTVLSTVADWLFGCAHRRTSFPMTCRTGKSGSAETYVVCLDCGKRFAYDWGAMRLAKEPARDVHSAPVSRLIARLVHHA
jgi:hypothetical protein